jgi:hypothetical protein
VVSTRLLVALVGMQQLIGCTLVVLANVLCKRFAEELVFL